MFVKRMRRGLLALFKEPLLYYPVFLERLETSKKTKNSKKKKVVKNMQSKKKELKERIKSIQKAVNQSKLFMRLVPVIKRKDKKGSIS